MLDNIIGLFQGINWLAVIAAILSSWLLGGLWYSKLLFGSVYCQGDKNKMDQRRHPGLIFLIAFIMWTITAIAFTFVLGPNPPLKLAIVVGLITGICFVTTSFGVNYAFSGKSLKIYLVDAGYIILQFTLYGLIFGYWH